MTHAVRFLLCRSESPLRPSRRELFELGRLERQGQCKRRPRHSSGPQAEQHKDAQMLGQKNDNDALFLSNEISQDIC